MTVSSTTSRRVHEGNDSATSFSFDFPITASGDLAVTLTLADGSEARLVEGADYAVSVPVYPGAGAILHPLSGPPLPAGARLTLERRLPIDQQLDLQNQGNFYAETHEGFFDKVVMICQQLDDALARAAKLPVSSTLSELFFPAPAAERVVMWNAAADGLVNGPSAGQVAAAAGQAAVAAGARAAAEAARDRAQDWAEAPDDEDVEPGRYSARHWAGQGAGHAAAAAASAAGLALPPVAAGTGGKLLQVRPDESGYRHASAEEALGGALPAGAVLPYAGASAPAGWAFCHGQALSRSAHPALFAALGTAFGAGDGRTTFNLPDLRGRAVFGRDDMGGSAAGRITSAVSGIAGTALGATGGDQAMQQHGHSAGSLGNHSHSGVGRSVNVSTRAVASGSGVQVVDAVALNLGGSNSTNLGAPTIHASGSGGSQNMPPAVVLNYIIRTN